MPTPGTPPPDLADGRAPGATADQPGAVIGDGLDVAPFHALHFDAARIAALGAVTSPPYDVVEPEGVALLEALDPHNVVRLILPREDPPCGDRYQEAAAQLDQWRRDGILAADEVASFYVYEHRSGEAAVVGFLGAVSLHDAARGVVLPHEQVMPEVVADREALLAATRANLEPVLLVHDGAPVMSETLHAVVTGIRRTSPLIDATTDDGHRHRLWRVPEPATPVVRTAFSARRALIADGHHRWTAAQRVAETLTAAEGPGPWNRCLALLVDAEHFPLQLRAIHRVVAGLELPAAVDRLEQIEGGVSVTRYPTDGVPEPADLLDPSAPGFLLVAGGLTVAVTVPVAAGQLDTEVLEDLLAGPWKELAGPVSYHHEACDALTCAQTHGGVAVLLRPPDLRAVTAAAAAARRMPQKTTSFGPKPRSGLLLRAFDLDG